MKHHAVCGWIELSLGLLLIGLAAGCGWESNNQSTAASLTEQGVYVSRQHAGNYPIRVVCTTGMVGDLVRNVGCSHVDVYVLMGPGVDPHLYKARPNDVRLLQEAALIFYNGLHLEGKMADVLESLARQGKLVFAIASALEPKDTLADGQQFDPHVWFDVQRWRKCLGLVREVLVQYDPAHEEDYRHQAENYDAKLLALDQWIRSQISTIPPKQRVLVTAHDAFRYFGLAYGLEVHGIQGISTESEASAREIDELVELLVARGIKAIFVESSVNPRNVQAVIQACRRRGHVVRLGGELFSDALGESRPELPPEDNPGTYIGMMRHNVRTIVEALR